MVLGVETGCPACRDCVACSPSSDTFLKSVSGPGIWPSDEAHTLVYGNLVSVAPPSTKKQK